MANVAAIESLIDDVAGASCLGRNRVQLAQRRAWQTVRGIFWREKLNECCFKIAQDLKFLPAEHLIEKTNRVLGVARSAPVLFGALLGFARARGGGSNRESRRHDIDPG